MTYDDMIRRDEYASIVYDIFTLAVKLLRSLKRDAGCLNLTDPITIPAGTPLRENDHRLVHDLHVSGLHVSWITHTLELRYLENRITYRNMIGEEYTFTPGEHDIFRDIIPIAHLRLIRFRLRLDRASRFLNFAKFLGVEQLVERIMNTCQKKFLAHLKGS